MIFRVFVSRPRWRITAPQKYHAIPPVPPTATLLPLNNHGIILSLLNLCAAAYAANHVDLLSLLTHSQMPEQLHDFRIGYRNSKSRLASEQ